MKLIEFLEEIKALGLPVIQTRDAAAHLHISTSHASKLLSRLESANQVVKLSHGLWALSKTIDPFTVPEYLTAPMPSYISCQSALYYHGLISQVPTTIYSVSLARTRVYETPIGEFSIHHIDPDFYFDYQIIGEGRIKMATPEKALIDILYLSPARSRLFATLPELDLPENFNVARAKSLIEKIKSDKRRTMVTSKFDEIIR